MLTNMVATIVSEDTKFALNSDVTLTMRLRAKLIAFSGNALSTIR